MPVKGIKYQFTALVWQHAGPGGWHFISLPPDLSAEIRGFFGSEEVGWGQLKTTAAIGGSEWKTAIWFDTKRGTYLLPLKAEIRKKEKLKEETQANVTLWI